MCGFVGQTGRTYRNNMQSLTKYGRQARIFVLFLQISRDRRVNITFTIYNDTAAGF
jgi:pyrimidine operon attenuation protein/uracil phosphoribosyltransferase